MLGCDTSCNVCADSTNSQCSSCNSGYFLQPSSTICLSTCTTGYYGNTTNGICTLCDTSCSTCTGASNTQCPSCNSGYYLQPSSTTCLSTCPSTNYYPNSTTNTCKSKFITPLNCLWLWTQIDKVATPLVRLVLALWIANALVVTLDISYNLLLRPASPPALRGTIKIQRIIYAYYVMLRAVLALALPIPNVQLAPQDTISNLLQRHVFLLVRPLTIIPTPLLILAKVIYHFHYFW